MSLRNTPSHSTGVEMLTVWDASDIAQALRKLGAREATIAQAMVSFMVKIPWAKVERTINASGVIVYMIGHSTLPEAPLQASEKVAWVQNRFAKVMAANDGNAKVAA